MNYIKLIESIESLQRYISNPVYKLSDNTVKELIRQYGNEEPLTLYRGLNFKHKDDYERFTNSIQDGVLILDTMSSWSRDREEALNFAITRPIFNIDKELSTDTDIAKSQDEAMVGYKGIILKTAISSNTGVDTSKAGIASEDEVILPSGQYSVEYEAINKFSDMIDSSDIDDIIHKTIIKPTLTDSYIEKFSKYIMKRYPDKLSRNTINELIKAYGGINLDESNIKVVDVDDDYYEKKLLINFNPWLYIFYNNSLLDDKTQSILFHKGTTILSYVKELLSKHGKVSLKSSGIRQLSDIIDNGRSYDEMIKITMKPTGDIRNINSLKGNDKKQAIKQERERLMAMLNDLD